MSDITEGIVRLSDKMGAAVRHHVRETMEREEVVATEISVRLLSDLKAA